MIYSGRTTAFVHEGKDWEKYGHNVGNECLDYYGAYGNGFYILIVKWTNCPYEVLKEVRMLYQDCYAKSGQPIWYDTEEGGYEVINDYLKSRGVDKCLIYWWW